MATAVVASKSTPYEFAGHKRPLSAAASGIRAVRPRERADRVQALDELPLPNGSIPSSSARPTQSVNVRVPIARACPETIVASSVAFATRDSAATSIKSLEQLNQLLSLSENVVTLLRPPVLAMFKSKFARSLYEGNDPTTDRAKLWRQRAKRFDAKQMLESAGLHRHPVVDHALDGIVATPPDHRDPVGRLGAMCNVAVAGPCPLALSVLHGSAPHPVTWVRNPAFFVAKKVTVLERVYVCLVALRVGAVPPSGSLWQFRYEVVFESGMEAFLKTAPVEGKVPAKLLLRTHELGRVVDTNFGQPGKPAVVVSVAIREAQPLSRENTAVSDARVMHTLFDRQRRPRDAIPPRNLTPKSREWPVLNRAFTTRREGRPTTTELRTGLVDALLDEDSDIIEE